MKDKLKIGLLGLGRIGKLHAANVQNAIPDAEITLAADPFLNEEMELFAKGIGIPRCTKNTEEIFSDPEIDAVFIC